MATPKRPALGRGLDSLIDIDDAPALGSSAIADIALDKITANPEQPRTDFDADSLEELADSIRQHGIIQPLSLRKTGPDAYQIIAGERRFRAARMAGLTAVPAYIRDVADEAALTEMALIENIQRDDLNAIEIALTFKKLMDAHSMTQERLAQRLGKKRTTVANYLRLLRLPAQVQLGLRDRKIDMGHARALLSIDDVATQLRLYAKILREGLSVRKVEELAGKIRTAGPDAASEGQTPEAARRFKSADFDILRDHLSQRFATAVKLNCDKNGKGRISFPFASEEELERLIAIFDTARTHE